MQVDLNRASRVLGTFAFGLIVLAALMNAKDIARYVRISTM